MAQTGDEPPSPRYPGLPSLPPSPFLLPVGESTPGNRGDGSVSDAAGIAMETTARPGQQGVAPDDVELPVRNRRVAQGEDAAPGDESAQVRGDPRRRQGQARPDRFIAMGQRAGAGMRDLPPRHAVAANVAPWIEQRESIVDCP